MNINDTVKINKLNDQWVSGAIDSLSGLTGVITKYRPKNAYGYDEDRPYLVTFTDRPKAWHSNQLPSESWWFAESEITVINSAPFRSINHIRGFYLCTLRKYYLEIDVILPLFMNVSIAAIHINQAAMTMLTFIKTSYLTLNVQNVVKKLMILIVDCLLNTLTAFSINLLKVIK